MLNELSESNLLIGVIDINPLPPLLALITTLSIFQLSFTETIKTKGVSESISVVKFHCPSSSIYTSLTPNSGFEISLKGGFENNMNNPNQAKNDMNIGPNQFFLSNSLVSTMKGKILIKPKGATNPNNITDLSKLVILTNE